MRKYLIAIILIMVLATMSVILAACGERNSYEEDGKITLETKQLYLTVGEKFVIVANYLDKGAKVKWSIDKPLVAEVDENGVVEVLGTGEAVIKATLPNGNSALCKLTAADYLVNTGFESELNKRRFKTVQEAAAFGGDIVVYSGVYPEYVTTDKPCKIIGVGSVVMGGISGTALDIDGVDFLISDPLPPNDATVAASDTLKLTNCSLTVSYNVEKPEFMTGGYGIYCGSNVQQISITKTVISNYRMGIYLFQTSATIDIVDSALSNCKIGISVDVKGSNATLENYKATGKISDNLYTNCYKSTEFLYFGTGYRGDLDFKDHTDIANNEQDDKKNKQ